MCKIYRTHFSSFLDLFLFFALAEKKFIIFKLVPSIKIAILYTPKHLLLFIKVNYNKSTTTIYNNHISYLGIFSIIAILSIRYTMTMLECRSKQSTISIHYKIYEVRPTEIKNDK